jgi:HlyD family secretion protein
MRYFMMAILLCVFAGCGNQTLDKQKFSGTLEITEHQLGPKASGRITTLNVEEGAMVKAGDVLATLDRYEQAKKDYERAKRIYKQGGSNLQALEYAKLALEDQHVIAPIDGIVLLKVHELGESIMAGAPIVVIGNVKDQWVKIYVPEGIINQIQLNQKVTLVFDGINKTYNGHVRYIATKAEFTPRNVQTQEERVTQAFAVKVVIDDPDVTAHPGVAVDVQFKI